MTSLINQELKQLLIDTNETNSPEKKLIKFYQFVLKNSQNTILAQEDIKELENFFLDLQTKKSNGSKKRHSATTTKEDVQQQEIEKEEEEKKPFIPTPKKSVIKKIAGEKYQWLCCQNKKHAYCGCGCGNGLFEGNWIIRNEDWTQVYYPHHAPQAAFDDIWNREELEKQSDKPTNQQKKFLHNFIKTQPISKYNNDGAKNVVVPNVLYCSPLDKTEAAPYITGTNEAEENDDFS